MLQVLSPPAMNLILRDRGLAHRKQIHWEMEVESCTVVDG